LQRRCASNTLHSELPRNLPNSATDEVLARAINMRIARGPYLLGIHGAESGSYVWINLIVLRLAIHVMHNLVICDFERIRTKNRNALDFLADIYPTPRMATSAASVAHRPAKWASGHRAISRDLNKLSRTYTTLLEALNREPYDDGGRPWGSSAGSHHARQARAARPWPPDYCAAGPQSAHRAGRSAAERADPEMRMIHVLRTTARILSERIGWNRIGFLLSVTIMAIAAVVLHRILHRY